MSLMKKAKSAFKIFQTQGIHELIFIIKNKYLKKLFFKTNNWLVKCDKAWKSRHGFVFSPLSFGCTDSVYKFQKKYVFSKNVKFSILVPLYNTPEIFLKEMIGSVLFQTYKNWELCLADGSDDKHEEVQRICEELSKIDSRIKYKKLEKNGGISENTNESLEMATGDYISLLDHDDLLHPSALFETMKAICDQNVDFIYTDEAIFESPDLRKIIHTNFKPDFAPDYFHCSNYICHFTSFKKSLLEEIGGKFNSEYDGAQDYDLFLRLTEKTSNIYHIKRCLYLKREDSSKNLESADINKTLNFAGQKALQNHFSRCGIDAEVLPGKFPNTYRVKYKIDGNPLISILIPNYDHWQTLKKCIDSIETLSTYKNYEIIIIENNSKQKETFDYYNSLRDNSRIKVVEWEGKFNYSAINNYGFKHAKGEYVLLLNNDVEVITPEWLEEMLMYAQRKDVGAVGAMLYYPSNKIQHAGVVLGPGGIAKHIFYKLPKGRFYYNGRNVLIANVSCVSAACLMISSAVFREVNGIDESYEIAFNDVDFCLRIREKGYLNVWTPFAELYHYESYTRGQADSSLNNLRFKGEINRFKERWGKELMQGDSFFNPNLKIECGDIVVNDNAVFSSSSV